MLVPKNKYIPNELSNDIIALSYPIEDVYLVAANAMGISLSCEKVNQ